MLRNEGTSCLLPPTTEGRHYATTVSSVDLMAFIQSECFHEQFACTHGDKEEAEEVTKLHWNILFKGTNLLTPSRPISFFAAFLA